MCSAHSHSLRCWDETYQSDDSNEMTMNDVLVVSFYRVFMVFVPPPPLLFQLKWASICGVSGCWIEPEWKAWRRRGIASGPCRGRANSPTRRRATTSKWTTRTATPNSKRSRSMMTTSWPWKASSQWRPAALCAESPTATIFSSSSSSSRTSISVNYSSSNRP